MTKGKFPNGLREVMDANNVGVTELGKILDESKQNVQRWRDEERRLKPEVALRIAKHFRISVNRLLLLPDQPDENIASSDAPHQAKGGGKISDGEAAAKLLELLEIIPEGKGADAYALLLSVFLKDDEKQLKTLDHDQSSLANRPRESTP